MKFQFGGFALGLVVGLLAGLALALGVALYITKAPVPFIDKVPQRTAEQDSAEAERNKRWDPNAPLVPKASAPAPTATAPAPAASVAAPAAPASAAAPAAKASADPFVYFVQVGAFTRNEDAEAQRARLAMLGLTARITEREQAGRTVFRVRLGPLDTRDAADGVQKRLRDAGMDGQLVRVQRT